MKSSSAKAIKRDLNLTGVYLQKTIYDSLKETHKFGVRREEPYSYRTAYSEHYKGTADLFAAIEIKNGGVLSLIIECKRADEKQKYWVFEMRDESSDEPLHPFVFCRPGLGVHYASNIQLPSLGYNTEAEYEKAILAFEFTDTKKGEHVLSRASTENVYTSLKQAFEPLASVHRNSQQAYDLAKSPQAELLIMPIVVTTANLSTMKYSASDVDRVSGTIDIDKVELMPKKWVHYEFPIPESLRWEGRLDLQKDEGYRPTKSPIFIVNAGHFDEFVSSLKADFARYVAPR